LLEKDVVPVVTGYIGATADGTITTLGRGGSDYSATYLASLIDAREVWIWTDVDGIMSGDPRKLKNAQIMDTISYQAVSEFAYFGAKVLHPRAVEPLIVPKIPLRVCNTFNADHMGTYINGHVAGKPKHLSAVTDTQGVLVFAPTVPSEMQHGELPAIQPMAEAILMDHVHQAISPAITVDSHTGRLLCYLVPTTARKSAAEDSVQAIASAFREHYPELGWRVEPVSIVAAIGVVDVQETMQVLNAVRSVKADLLAMGQGSPECALLVVPPTHTLRVLKRLHNMAVSTHHRLSAAGAGELCPPEVPTNRQRRASRKRRDRRPPQRGIPL
jgi:aspartate kinase